MAERDEPADGDERAVLLGWLAFHRAALADKCDGPAPEQLIERPAEPSDLSLLGLVRHLTIMERVYGSGALGLAPRELIYCDDEHPDGDFLDLVVDDVEPSFTRWAEERRLTDAALAGFDGPASLDHASPHGNGRSVRWNLVKLLQEYARHNGHADLLRERIDGEIGE